MIDKSLLSSSYEKSQADLERLQWFIICLIASRLVNLSSDLMHIWCMESDS